jgi:hypothetical protein
MIGTCSSLGTQSMETCGDEIEADEEMEKIKQTEDKIYQAHVIRQEI